MRSIVALAIMLMMTFQSFAQVSTKYDLFVREVRSFIKRAKPMSIKNGKYEVYCVSLFNRPPDNTLFFSINSICNAYSMNGMKMNYYIYIDSEIVLINGREFKDNSFLHFFNEIDSNINKQARKKLFHGKHGAITGAGPGIIISINGTEIKRRFYENASYMPLQFSIWPPLDEEKIQFIPAPADVHKFDSLNKR